MKKLSSLAFVFPGQGSQQLGMLKTIANIYPQIEQTFREASLALDLDLWALAQLGPEEKLNETVNTQPVILTAGVALWRVWQDRGGFLPDYLAGHSLGEYTALVCANAMSLQEGVTLVALRGKLMQEAVPQGVGAMAATLGLDEKSVQEVCQEASQGEVVSPANYNSIGQVVIAGTQSAIERAMTLAKAKGAKRVILLPVSVPSHCQLMQPAAQKLKFALEKINLIFPSIPIIHNVDVRISENLENIRDRLIKQLYLPVRWVETIQKLKNLNVESIVECGPGKVLTGLIKRIESSFSTFNIENASDMDLALERKG